MGSEKILSIVIPSYNVSRYLPEVIPTYLVPEILDKLELLIVNDGSKDDTAEIAARFAERYPDTIKVINKENGGHGSTINAGAVAASGKYFKVIDGDDWVDSACLVKFINVLCETDVDMVLNSFVRVLDGTGEREVRKIRGIKSERIYDFKEIIPIIQDSYAMHGTTFKTEVFRKAKRIDEHCFYVDQEYLMYPAQYVSKTIYFDIPLYQYRIGNSEQSMSLKNMQRNRKMHEKVIKSLLDNLTTISDGDKVKELVRYRAAKMCQLQIDILISIHDKTEAKRELLLFMDMVKNIDRETYKSIPGKKAKLIRVTGGVGYDLIKAIKRG